MAFSVEHPRHNKSYPCFLLFVGGCGGRGGEELVFLLLFLMLSLPFSLSLSGFGPLEDEAEECLTEYAC